MADTRGIRAGRAFVELGVSDKLTKGLEKAQQQLAAFGTGLRSVGLRLGALGASAVTALFATARSFAATGDALDEMSARTGVSVETLSELGLAIEMAGADLETFEAGLRKMQKIIAEAAEGSQSAADALGKLGLSVQDVLSLSPERQFKLIADRLSRVEDPALRTALAMELFGKSGTRLLPLLQEGARGLEQFQEQARALGLTISTETAKDAAALADALDILWRVVKQAVFAIGAALAPVITQVAQQVTRAVVAVSESIKQNRQLVVVAFQVAVGITAVGGALIVIGGVISALGAALGGVATVLTAMKAAWVAIGAAISAIASPIGVAITLIAGLGAAALLYTGVAGDALTWLGEQFGRLRDFVGRVVGGITDALAAGDLTLAVRVLWLGLRLVWEQGVAALNRAWLGAKRFFIGTAQSMWFGALALAQQGFHAIEVAWIETTAFLSTTWTDFTSDLQQAWGLIQNWLTQRWLDLMKLFGQLTDEQAQLAKQMADEDFAIAARGIEERRGRTNREREGRRQRERDQAATVNEATLAEIGRQFDEAQQALNSGTEE
ncbi:MAG: phage tail tape measure protein, partial [Phycisphaerae bacterium]|nr:phage tail tape measure protein [Phycisphaerae bacterium]